MAGKRLIVPLAAVALAAWPLTGGPARAGKEGVDPGPVFVPPLVAEDAAGLSAEAARVAQEVTLAKDFCARLVQKEYTIDCLAAELGKIADSMSSTGDLAPAKAAIADASQKLSGIARKHRSKSLPTAVAKSPSRSSPRPLVPVETAQLPQASAEAIGVIEETGTILLRSSETSAEAAGFVAISTAVTSSTILLRSI